MKFLLNVFIAFTFFTSFVFAYEPKEAEMLCVQSLFGGWGDQGKVIITDDFKNGNNHSLNLIWSDDPNSKDIFFWAMSRPLENDDFESISYDLYIKETKNTPNLVIYLGESDLDRWQKVHNLSSLEKGKWLHFSHNLNEMEVAPFGNGKREKDLLNSFHIEPDGKEAYVNIYLDNIFITCKDGRKIDLLSSDSVIPAYSKKTDFLFEMNTISPYMKAFVAGDAIAWAGEENLDKIKKFKSLFPSFAVSNGGYINHIPYGEVSQNTQKLNIALMGENQDAWDFQFDITKAGAWCVRFDGESNNITPNKFDTGHSACINHPDYVEMQKRRIDAAVAAGIPRFTFVDYVLPYFGGRWGYSEADKIAYKKALLGTDGGIKIKNDNGELRTIYFWDYYEDNTGLRFSPADLAISSFEDYEPITDENEAWNDTGAKRRNFNVFLSLNHYSWLKFLDTVGAYYAEKGGEIWIIPNPEDVYTGVDYIYGNRLAYLGGNLLEYFGNPVFLDTIYRSGRYLADDAKKANTLLGPVLETNAGGHGVPYYDPWVSYAVAYDLYSALNATVTKNDFLQNQSFEEMTNPENTYAYDRFRDIAVKQIAFDNYKADIPEREKTSVAVISQRNPNRLKSTPFHDMKATPHIWEGSPAISLNENGYNFDLIDTVSFSPIEDYNAIFIGVTDIPKTTAERLRNWLENGNNTLVFSANQPFNRADGIHYTLWHNSEFFRISDENLGKDFNIPTVKYTDNSQKLKVDKVSSIFKNTFDIGDEIEIIDGYYDLGNTGEVLLSAGTKPIVSKINCGKGSVIYLHYKAGENLNNNLDDKIFSALAEHFGLMQEYKSNENLYVHKYNIDTGYSVILWSKEVLDKWEFIYDGNLKQRLSDKAVGISETALVKIKNGDYIIYNVTFGTVEKQKVSNEYIELELNETTCGVYYILPDNQKSMDKIDSIQKSLLEPIITGKFKL